MAPRSLLASLAGAAVAAAAAIDSTLIARQASSIESCPGYTASNVQTSGDKIVSADLNLAGPACNVYGSDLDNLRLLVEYQSPDRLHVKISDAANQVYQVPESVWPRPGGDSSESNLAFSLTESPFSFAVTRISNGEVLFNTSGSQVIFESQYLRLRTSLPENPYLYGLGEHTDPMRLNTTDYLRTIWARDSYGIPPGTNLYGSHPVYYDHRGDLGTHAVFLLNSNGMDIKINNTAEDGQYLEYNTVGGVLDFYFLAGPSPSSVARQYSEVVGLPAMMPYWGLGYHNCRYGYRDVYDVAGVIANYSAADIPLETMWTDIDYMDGRAIFTTDPLRYPVPLLRQVVDYLHSHDQQYIMMVDPAVAAKDYPTYNRGVDSNAFLRTSNGSVYLGVVWPGPTSFPDWFSPNVQEYWDGEFNDFFNPEDGIDIDGLWTDMNEASNFCPYPCTDPVGFAERNNNPPQPPPVRLGPNYQIPGFGPEFQPQCVARVSFNVEAQTYFGENIAVIGNAITLGNGEARNAAPVSPDNYPIWSAVIDLPPNSEISYQYVRLEADGSYIYEATNRTLTTSDCNGMVASVNDVITTQQGTPPSVKRDTPVLSYPSSFSKRQTGDQTGLPGRDLINPAYKINNVAGSLSNLTLDTDLVHSNGLTEYDVHNLYGHTMSIVSRQAMQQRREGLMPLVLTRSSFPGTGKYVGHWLGDNTSNWVNYLRSIGQMLDFISFFQVPYVGSDVCGFIGDTNDLLCARWATLGAFSPFYRNHNADGAASQEFYRWPIVASAARNAINTRYQLLDYIYTAFKAQTTTGEPMIKPMFFVYPDEADFFTEQYQYFYGDAILVAPVTTENSTVGSVRLPAESLYYDFYTHAPIRGTGEAIVLPDVPYDTIPLFIKGGSIVPLRASSANTTKALREQDFTLIIAPDDEGNASGSLYIDDGVSLEQPTSTQITFKYSSGRFAMDGQFDYDVGEVGITKVVVLDPNTEGARVAEQTTGGYATTLETLDGAKNMAGSKMGLSGGFEGSLA
ncbi:putative alpha-glucosidase [Elsinoe ampelina]|uniref:Probable alpha/beta-glucosidase agdC n=1 Tax=Elsinoe ampelina TaxID=302913 RepID=A0A6A6GLR3_9PEZI|nr:putative alpha-glucosidase [Elsinoe ampelina]